MSEAAFDAAWPAEPAAVASLREAAATEAERLGADADAVAAVRLAVSEAATNVVVHAYADAPAPGEVRLHVAREDGELVVTVTDDGAGLRPREDSPGLGLGLPLLAQVAADLEVRTPPGGGTEIQMRFRRRPPLH